MLSDAADLERDFEERNQRSIKVEIVQGDEREQSVAPLARAFGKRVVFFRTEDRMGRVLQKQASNETNDSPDRRTEADRGDGRTVPATDAGAAAGNQTARGTAEDQADQAVITPEETAEYREIEARYFNPDGTEKPGARLAPNGKLSNLNKRQWIQVRTASFKKWFGDWMLDTVKAATIDAGSRQFNGDRQRAVEWVTKPENKIIGNHENDDTGMSIGVTTRILERKAVSGKAASKSDNEADHYELLRVLPDIIKHAKWVQNTADKDGDTNIAGIHRFVAHALVNGESYAVKLTVKEYTDTSLGNRFYTHELVEIAMPSVVTPERSANMASNLRKTDGIHYNFTVGSLVDAVNSKDAALGNPLSFDRQPVSKVVDENGEPLVVYHQDTSGNVLYLGGRANWVDTPLKGSWGTKGDTAYSLKAEDRFIVESEAIQGLRKELVSYDKREIKAGSIIEDTPGGTGFDLVRSIAERLGRSVDFYRAAEESLLLPQGAVVPGRPEILINRRTAYP